MLEALALHVLAGRSPAEYRHVHEAADSRAPRLRRVFKRAFRAGRVALRRVVLEDALTREDVHGVLILANDAVLAMQKVLSSDLTPVLTAIMRASGNSTARQLRGAFRASADVATIEDFAFDQTNPRAEEWVKSHGAMLIDGVTKTTRDDIRELIETAFTGEYDVHELADLIENHVGDASRAETIARTESMTASNQGQLEAWQQATDQGFLTGREQKEWITTPDDRLCPVCEPLDGVTVALDDNFDVDGDQIDAPPAHPNCRCTLGLAAGN